MEGEDKYFDGGLREIEKRDEKKVRTDRDGDDKGKPETSVEKTK